MYLLPADSISSMTLWMARVPLLCFHVCEWHYPDRVRRQFGLVQCIPHSCYPDYGTHTTTRRGNLDTDWSVTYQWEVDMWSRRYEERIHSTLVVSTDQHYHSQYMDWYRQRTRRFMTVAGAAHARTVSLICLKTNVYVFLPK